MTTFNQLLDRILEHLRVANLDDYYNIRIDMDYSINAGHITAADYDYLDSIIN